MRRFRPFAVAPSLAAVILSIATVGFGLTADSPIASQVPSTLPRRAVGPFLAADSSIKSVDGLTEANISAALGGVLKSSDGRLTLTFEG